MGNQFQRFEYEIKDGEICINSCFSVGSSIEIPEKIDGCPVVEIGPYAFARDVAKQNFATSRANGTPVPKLQGERLEEIVLPRTVKRVGRYVFYNCRNLRRIEFWNGLVDLGAGAFTGCHKVSEIGVHLENGKKSCLREILIELPEEQMVDLYYEDGHAKVLFPEFFEESVENTPARILEIHTHGSGMLYRNCFIQKELDFKLYDEQFDKARGKEFSETLFRLCFQRLVYPYQLTEKAKSKYIMFLKENLEKCALWVMENGCNEQMFFMADNCVDKLEDLEILIAAANSKNEVGVLSYLMDKKHQQFKIKRKIFEL